MVVRYWLGSTRYFGSGNRLITKNTMAGGEADDDVVPQLASKL